jgi:hypothetical protein
MIPFLIGFTVGAIAAFVASALLWRLAYGTVVLPW